MRRMPARLATILTAVAAAVALAIAPAGTGGAAGAAERVTVALDQAWAQKPGAPDGFQLLGDPIGVCATCFVGPKEPGPIAIPTPPVTP